MINFRSYQDLITCIRNNIDQIPPDIDLIVGIPRSGLLVANLIALTLNKPLSDLDGFINNKIITSGTRLINPPKDLSSMSKVLIIDDSLNFGNALRAAKEKLNKSKFKGKLYFSAVYVTPGQQHLMDYYFETCPQPRVFEWNIMHHGILENSCVDIDGVLCRDPSDVENDDGKRYIKFISSVPASIVPSRTISYLVTSRLEKYRELTEKWLHKSGINYNHLIMMQYKSKEERIAANRYGEFKAEAFQKSGCELFIESNPEQARLINQLTRKDVYSFSNSVMLHGESFLEGDRSKSKAIIPENKHLLPKADVYQIKKRKPIKAVVYTCITANYDELYNHSYTNPDWDYVCYTDDLTIKNDNNSHWKIRPLKFNKLDSTRNQRWHKLHPYKLFPEYKYSLWIDSNVDILSPRVFEDIYDSIDSKKSISIAPHPERDCLYEEMQACVEHKKDSIENMQPQIEKFKKTGFPSHYGLFETNIMFRVHNLSKVKKIMTDWWYWIEHFSKRDQLSLTFVLWKNNQKAYSLSDTSYRNNDGRVYIWPHRTELRPHIKYLNHRIESQSQQIESQSQQIESQSQQIETQSQQINELTNIIENVRNARFFKLWQLIVQSKLSLIKVKNNPKILAKLPSKTVHKLRKVMFHSTETDFLKDYRSSLEENYKIWLRKHYPTKKQLDVQRKESKSFDNTPLISIITPTYNTPVKYLRECIESVINQSYPHWELCMADDFSSDEEVRRVIKEYADKDNRIKYRFRKKNGHICQASNTALQMASGDWIGLLDHDDFLWPNALYEVAKLINNHPNSDLIYSDEDKLDEAGSHVDPFFKPDWSPDFLRSVNYITHFTLIRKSLISTLGGFRQGYEGAQDWDLFLRITREIERRKPTHPLEKEHSIRHIPKILYSWRKSETSTASEKYVHRVKDYAEDNQKKALEDDLNSRGLKGEVIKTKYKYLWRMKYEITGTPLISIIIPTKDNKQYINRCLDSIYQKSTYTNFEIIIIDTGSEQEIFDLYNNYSRKYNKFSVHKWKDEFNFSSVCNFGAKKSKGDYLLFLNNDTEVISAEWIQCMLEFAQHDHVGAVGAKLLYPNKLLQHAGIILGIRGGPVKKGVAGHAFKRWLDTQDHGIFNSSIYSIRNYSAVTAACLMIKKNKFIEVDGFNSAFRIAFNDVDFNLKLNTKGYFNVFTSFARLYHHESVSVGDPSRGNRDLNEFSKEITLMHNKWGHILQNDPFYNSNFSLDHEDFSLRV